MQGTLVLCAALIFIAFSGSVAPAAAPSPYRAMIEAINAGRFDEARAIAIATARTEDARTVNVAFVDALVLKRQGRYDEAVAAFRALLARNPRFERVRSELAHTLYLMGDDTAASHQFGLLAAAAPSSQQRDLYGRFLTAIDKRRPFNWDAYISLAPNSNINGGTDTGEVLVGGVPFTTKKKQGGVGVAYGLSGAYRFDDLFAGHTLTVGAGITGSTFQEHDSDATTIQSFAEVSRDVAGWRMGVGIGGEWRLAGRESARWGIGPQASLAHDFGRAGRFTANASWRAMRYATDTYLDGSEISLTVRQAFAADAATTVAFAGTFMRRITTTSMQDYNSIRPAIEIYREFSNGLIGDLAVAYEMRRYDTDYYLLDEPRRDDLFTATAGVTFRKVSWHGFAPRLEYTFQMSNSNSEQGDTTSHGVGLTLTKRY